MDVQVINGVSEYSTAFEKWLFTGLHGLPILIYSLTYITENYLLVTCLFNYLQQIQS